MTHNKQERLSFVKPNFIPKWGGEADSLPKKKKRKVKPDNLSKTNILWLLKSTKGGKKTNWEELIHEKLLNFKWKHWESITFLPGAFSIFLILVGLVVLLCGAGSEGNSFAARRDSLDFGWKVKNPLSTSFSAKVMILEVCKWERPANVHFLCVCVIFIFIFLFYFFNL